MSDPSAALAQAISRTARRYNGVSRFGEAYVAAKLRLDPLYHDLLALPGPLFGDAIDLGCGRGQLGILLLETGAARSVLAIDRQEGLLEEARLAGSGLSFGSMCHDIAEP